MGNSNLEVAKNSLEKINKIKDNLAKDTIISILGIIPVVGTFVDIQTEKLLSEFQYKKREELIEIILNNNTCITHDMVNNVEFILDFAKTLEAVNKLSSNSKVKYFGNLLRNSYLSKCKVKNNEFDNNLQLLLSLSYSDIIVTESLSSNYVQTPEKPSKNMSEFINSLKQTIEGIVNELQIPTETVIATLDKLSGMGVCSKTTYHSYNYGLSKSLVHYKVSPLYLNLRDYILNG